MLLHLELLVFCTVHACVRLLNHTPLRAVHSAICCARRTKSLVVCVCVDKVIWMLVLGRKRSQSLLRAAAARRTSWCATETRDGHFLKGFPLVDVSDLTKSTNRTYTIISCFFKVEGLGMIPLRRLHRVVWYNMGRQTTFTLLHKRTRSTLCSIPKQVSVFERKCMRLLTCSSVKYNKRE